LTGMGLLLDDDQAAIDCLVERHILSPRGDDIWSIHSEAAREHGLASDDDSS